MKLEVISKYARISEEWLCRDYGSGLGATLSEFGPNFSPSSIPIDIFPNRHSVFIVTQLEAIKCWSSEPAHLPAKIRWRYMGQILP